MPGVVVVLRSWVGTVKEVSSMLHLLFADGTRCIVRADDAEDFDDAEELRGETDFAHRQDFHPGQVLVAPAVGLANAQWLDTPKDIATRPNKTFRVRCPLHFLYSDRFYEACALMFSLRRVVGIYWHLT